MISPTSQFQLDHAAEIDRAEFLSRYGRTHSDEREKCLDEIEAIYQALEDQLPASDYAAEGERDVR